MLGFSWKNAIFSFFMLMFMGSLEIQAAGETFLYLFYNAGNVGDKNQAQGIARALEERLPSQTKRKEFDLKEQQDVFLTAVRRDLADNSNDIIIIAAGDGTISVLKQLKPQPHSLIVHSSHQYTSAHAGLNGVVDIVALPEFMVTDSAREAFPGSTTTLLLTPGVAHNLSLQDIQQAYQDNKASIPEAKTYLGVILAGDAPTSENKMLYYTPEEAAQLAVYMASRLREKEVHLLVLNGPRTGKHDLTTGKVIESRHRDGQRDPVTTAFVEALTQQGLNEGQDFTVFDFQFDQKFSAYPVVLGALEATRSPIFVDGGSTSMVSETADNLPGFVTVFTNGSMNDNHRKFCETEFKAGRVGILENKKGEWALRTPSGTPSASSQSAAAMIAQAIQKRLDEKKHDKE